MHAGRLADLQGTVGEGTKTEGGGEKTKEGQKKGRDLMSPTQRALKYFRDRGGECVTLEKFIWRAKIKKDVWGADILVRRGAQLIAVQACDHTSHGKHIARALLLDSPVKNWLLAEVPYYIYSERKGGPRGETKRWIPRITQVCFGVTGELDIRELGVTEDEPELNLV
jgi:hypothetical protein